MKENSGFGWGFCLSICLQVVLAPTGFLPFDQSTNFDAAAVATERLELASASGTSLGLRSGIAKARYGLLQYVTNSGLTNSPNTSVTPLVLDERAAVGNLSRNIVIQAPNDSLWQTQGFGAHVMAMHGSFVRLDGVELRRVGQLFRTGRQILVRYRQPPAVGQDSRWAEQPRPRSRVSQQPQFGLCLVWVNAVVYKPVNGVKYSRL